MKTLTLEQFQELVSTGTWTHTQQWDIVVTQDRPVEFINDDGDLDQRHVPHSFGWASLETTCSGITLRYTEGFNYDHYDEDSFTHSTEGQNTVWEIEGAEVVDEDGDRVEPHNLADYLPDEFSDIDWNKPDFGFDETIDIDFDEDSDMSEEMEEHIVARDNEPNLRFTGQLLGSASSKDPYGNDGGRWTILRLYKTRGGKYVCEQIGRTCWQGERDRFAGSVCETLEEVQAFFGHRWLAKELYEEAGIDAVHDIE